MKQIIRTSLLVLLVSLFSLSFLSAQSVHAAFLGEKGSVLYGSLEMQGDAEHPSVAASIKTMNSDSTGKQTIIDVNIFNPAPEWSASGQKITWSDRDGQNVQDIFVANADGSNKQRVTNLSDDEAVNGYSGGAMKPSFSPDGNKIIYEKSFNGFENPSCDIHIVNIDGTNDTSYEQGEGECHGAPRISPDGTRIAYFRSNGNSLELYTMDINGGDSQLLTSIPWSGSSIYSLSQADLNVVLDWSPDGSRIVYSRQDGTSFGESSILTIPASGGEPHLLKGAVMDMSGSVYTTTSYFSPHFTPEGDISFTELHGVLNGVEDIENSTVSGTTNVKIMDANGSEEQTIDSFQVSNATFVNFYNLYYSFISVSIQPVHNKATIQDPNSGHTISIQTPEGTTLTCSSSSKETDNTSQDSDYTYPLGLVHFCFDTTNTDNEVSLTFVTDLKPNEVTPRKYNPTTKTYSTLPGSAHYSITETTPEGKHALKLTYTLTDNGPLDQDPAVGSITDPVGLATSGDLANTGQNITLYILTALTTLTLGSGLLLTRKFKS